MVLDIILILIILPALYLAFWIVFDRVTNKKEKKQWPLKAGDRCIFFDGEGTEREGRVINTHVVTVVIERDEKRYYRSWNKVWKKNE